MARRKQRTTKDPVPPQVPKPEKRKRTRKESEENDDGPSTSKQPARTFMDGEKFYQLLEHKLIRDSLDMDPCLKLTDKYLLAMVRVYFQRARIKEEEYIAGYFFGAL
ncbi:speedy protein 1-B-like [Xenopus laevis]|nr:speedy protein 1-B-like [Xenopus laevis]